MYSMVVMAALTTGTSAPECCGFFRNMFCCHTRSSCNSSCYGCTGCYGCNGCYGGAVYYGCSGCQGGYGGCYGGCYGSGYGSCYGGGYNNCSGCHGCYSSGGYIISSPSPYQ